MTDYTLTARLKSTVSVVGIDAENSTDATMEAIRIIMDNAYGGGPLNPWTNGEITLTGPDGTVLHRMESKA